MSRPSHGFPFRAAPFPALAVALSGAAFAMLAAGACSNLRTLPGWRRAVVIHAPTRVQDAETARHLLASDGWHVHVVPQGPASRTRSSVAVYDARKYPNMPEHVAEVLEPIGAAGGDAAKMDVLPFFGAGPGGSSVVVWLAD